MPLVINGLWDRHTDRQTHIQMHEPKQFQETRREWPNGKLNKKWPNDNKYNSGLCVFVPKFAYLSQQYNETSTIMMCNSKNLIH